MPITFPDFPTFLDAKKQSNPAPLPKSITTTLSTKKCQNTFN